jgi:hypothetical protein
VRKLRLEGDTCDGECSWRQHCSGSGDLRLDVVRFDVFICLII